MSLDPTSEESAAHEQQADNRPALMNRVATSVAACAILVLPIAYLLLHHAAHPVTQNADYWINESLHRYQDKNYQGCIEAAEQALKLKPDSVIAYNNIGAAYASLQQWDLAIQNEREALRVQPDFVLARNNLALYERQKNGATIPAAASMTPEDWLSASVRDNRAGKYEESIQDARSALKLRPSYAEAWNNIAANYAAMHQWDDAIAAAKKALEINPNFQLAKNNLAWAISEKKAGVR